MCEYRQSDIGVPSWQGLRQSKNSCVSYEGKILMSYTSMRNDLLFESISEELLGGPRLY